MKKLISIILAFVFVIGVFLFSPITVNAISHNVENVFSEIRQIKKQLGNEKNGLVYTFDGLGYVVTDCNTSVSGALKIPSSYNGQAVTEIGVSAFSGCSGITSITIPDSVKKIGANAFYNCKKLVSIDLGQGVNYIGNSAFAGCSSLSELNIPASVTEIDLECYVRDYYDSSDVFEGCRSLAAFNVSSGNSNYASVDGVLFTKDKTILLKYPRGKCVTLYIVPTGTKTIGETAFYNCLNLDRLSLGDTLETIEKNAFSDCETLTEIKIPDSVKTIKEGAFASCTALSNVSLGKGLVSLGECSTDGYKKETDRFPIETEWYNDSTSSTSPGGATSAYHQRGVFFNTAITSISIPDNVQFISGDAFDSCYELENITMGNNVKKIESDAFTQTAYYDDPANWVNGMLYIGNNLVDSADSLGGTVKVLPGTKCIADRAFFYNLSITSVILPSDISAIGDEAFYYCENLQNIEFSGNVGIIGKRTFAEDNLKSVVFKGSVDYIGDNAFNYGETTPSIFVSDLSSWCNTYFASEIEYDWNLYVNGKEAKNITIPKTVSYIQPYAFYGCNSIENVTIEEGVKRIGGYAFYDCNNLTSVKLPKTLNAIERHALSNYGYDSFQLTYNGKKSEWFKIEKDYYAPHDCDNYLGGDDIKSPTHKAVITSGGVKISWEKIPAATGYGIFKVKYKIYPNVGPTYGGTVTTTPSGNTSTYYPVPDIVLGADVTSYIDKDVEAGYEYSYAVVTMYGDYCSGAKYGQPVRVSGATEITSVTSASNGVKFTWSEVPGVEGYIIFKLIDGAYKNIAVVGPSTLAFTDQTAVDGETYCYAVATMDEMGNAGQYSEFAHTYKKLTTLSTPKVSVKSTSSGVKVSWKAIENAESYTVYRRTYNAKTKKYGSWKTCGTVTTTSYVDTKAKSGTKYIYTVKALNGDVKSGIKSSSSILFLSQPTVKIANASTGVKVTWNKITGATGYKVYRAEYVNGKWSGWKSVKTIDKGSTVSWTDKSVKSGVKYKYTVKAVNGKTGSTYKSSSSLLYLAQPKVAVRALSNGIKVAWVQSTGATSYKIYRSEYNAKTKKWSSWKGIKTAKSTSKSYVDKTAKKGVKYRYTVRAVNGSYKSTFKASSSVKR